MVHISNKIVTYSLLAHINDHNQGIRDLTDLFIPLTKRVLSSMAEEGVHQGKHISEIKERVDTTFHLDIPYPLLSKIISSIAEEVRKNKGAEFIVYKDNSFQINNYSFTEFDDEIAKEESDIERVEELYRVYLEINGVKYSKGDSFVDFIDKNRAQLISYFRDKKEPDGNLDKNFVFQANFINSIKSDAKIYKSICKIYLGSIVVSYLEFNPEFSKESVAKEFLLDTNFIVGLLDLNTIESTHTCRKIVEICERLNYRVAVLDYTLDETRGLIERAANTLDSTFLPKKLDPDSIYNACDRRNLSKTDLEKIHAELEITLKNEFSISIISETSRLRNEARYSNEFKIYKGIRSTEWSALHDATAVKYVQRKRSRKVRDYYSANCFFVTNTKRDFGPLLDSESVSELIRAEDLVNILWLTNPNAKLNIANSEMVEMGMSRLISSTLNSSLPSSRIIRELDENIQKYAKYKISDRDIIRVADRIANKTIQNLEQINKLAKTSPVDFVDKLLREARKQEQREKKFIANLKFLVNNLQETSNDKLKEKQDLIKKEYDAALEKEKKDSETRITQISNDFILKSNKLVFSSLNKAKIRYDSLAHKKSIRVIGFCLIPPVIILISIHLFIDNEILNQISLMGIFVLPVFTFLYYAITNKEWNLKELHIAISEKYKQVYYKKFDFDLDYYEKLKGELGPDDQNLND